MDEKRLSESACSTEYCKKEGPRAEKPSLSLPVIVEGRYDKSAILGIYRATVITTDGFGIFNSAEKQALIRKIARGRGVIVLTDSDGGGIQIRSFLSRIIPKDKIFQLYIPEIAGKERRKRHASKAGTLGVEGVGGEVLRSVLSRFVSDGDEAIFEGAELTPSDLYRDGLSGGADSQSLRDALCQRLALPAGMSAKSLLAALNVAVSREEYSNALDGIEDSLKN